MNLEKKFNNLNNQNNQPENKSEKYFDQSEKGITRRDLLAGLGALGLLGWLGKNKAERLLSNLFSKSKDEFYSELDLIKKSLHLPSFINQEKKPISPERKLIEEEDEKSIQEILDFHQKRIHLDATKIKKVELFWEDKYCHYPPLRRSFEKAYFEMGAWKNRLEKIFQKELSDVLPRQQINDLVYLAIPESHWQIYYWQDGSVSSKGAVGPYQIIKSTAREYGLRINKAIDERRDPELSATACAKIIRDLLHDFDNNLDLAISGYNGSFVYQYKKAIDGSNMSYENFLSYANQQINQIKENLNHLEYYYYRIHQGDTLRKIALITHIPIQKLAEINNIKDRDTIKIGQKIKIPLRGSTREKIFNYKIHGLEENLVYPAKYKAIINLIHQGVVRQQEESLNFRVIIIRYLTHIVKRGETIYSLSQKYHLQPKQIISANPGIKAKKLPTGFSLVIPSPNSTLAQISHNTGKSLSHLKKINPAILDAHALLPNGFEVRV